MRINRLLAPLVAAALCLVVGAVALQLLGYRLAAIVETVWQHALLPGPSCRQWFATLVDATPLILTGLAITVAFKAAVWNIGAQGQYIVGAICATAVALHVRAPAPLLVPATLLAGMVGAGLFAGVAATLHLLRGVPVVLSTLLLNFVASALLLYVLRGPLHGHFDYVISDPLPAQAILPSIGRSAIHIGFPIALITAIVIAIVIRQTVFGFRLRVVGENPIAARFAGIKVGHVTFLSLALSGALAGLGGAIETTGRLPYQLLLSSGDSGYGFTGIAVALLGRLSPLGTVAAAIFFGLLNTAFRALEAEMGIPFATAQAMQGAIVILMLILSYRRP